MDNKLEKMIQDSGMKKSAIAKRMGISSNYLWRLLQNPKQMNFSYIDRLAEIINVETTDVVEAIKEMEE